MAPMANTIHSFDRVQHIRVTLLYLLINKLSTVGHR